jgi:Recombination endonuclease VII
MHESKVCNKCGERKPLSAFYAMKEMRDGHRNDCIECNKAGSRARRDADPESNRARAREWYWDNKERSLAYGKEYKRRPEVKRRQRDYYYRKTYGISADEFDAILELQGGRCLICKAELPDRLGSRHLDHDHKPGRSGGSCASTATTGSASSRTRRTSCSGPSSTCGRAGSSSC